MSAGKGLVMCNEDAPLLSDLREHSKGQVSWPRYTCDCAAHQCAVIEYLELIQAAGCNGVLLRAIPDTVKNNSAKYYDKCKKDIDNCLGRVKTP